MQNKKLNSQEYMLLPIPLSLLIKAGLEKENVIRIHTENKKITITLEDDHIGSVCNGDCNNCHVNKTDCNEECVSCPCRDHCEYSEVI